MAAARGGGFAADDDAVVAVALGVEVVGLGGIYFRDVSDSGEKSRPREFILFWSGSAKSDASISPIYHARYRLENSIFDA